MKKQEVKDNMKKLFQSGKTWVLIAAVAGIVLGIIMLANPTGFENMFCLILGIALILFGVISLVQVFREEARSLRFGGMVPGVLSLATGLAFCLKPQAMLGLIWFLVGVVILIDAVYKLEHAFTMKFFGFTYWWISLLEAILTMILAVVVMIISDHVSQVTRISGGFLLANGVFDLVEFILLMKATKFVKNGAPVETSGTLHDGSATDLTDPRDDR